METIKIQHLFGRFSIFFLVLIVVVFAEEYSINRLCLNINGFPFIFMNAFMIVGIAYIYQKATRKLFIKEFEYEIYEDFFYIDGNKYEYQDVIKCEIHYFDYFFSFRLFQIIERMDSGCSCFSNHSLFFSIIYIR